MSEAFMLPAAVRAWGAPSFADVLRRELAAQATRLPLQQALSYSSRVAKTPLTVVVGEAGEDNGKICVTVGIFYEGVVAGCNCSDDPSPDNVNTEHCRLRLEIGRDTAECGVWLLDHP